MLKKALFTSVAVAGLLMGTVASAGVFDGVHDTTSGKDLTATGTVFNQTLYSGYKDLSDRLSGLSDVKDVELFNHKAVLAGHESPTDPEEVMDRELSSDDQRMFGDALYRMRMAFNKGAKEFVPVESATAQVSFDCWIEAVEDEATQRASECKAKFEDALAKMEAAANKQLVMITVSPPLGELDLAPKPEPIPQAVLDQYFLIPFAFDSTEFVLDGNEQLAGALEALNQYPTLRVNLIAHADRSGSNEYNRGLSQRRADAVLSRLVQFGVTSDRIDIVEAVGETRPMVPTEDGVKKQENRVVEIDLKN